LDADYPENGVLIPRRNTARAKAEAIDKKWRMDSSQLVDAVLEEFPARIDAPAVVDINRNTPG
jgi:hypothetical protein